jgi:hypothetical protein
VDRDDDFVDLAEHNVYQHGQLERAAERISNLENENENLQRRIFEDTVEIVSERCKLHLSLKHQEILSTVPTAVVRNTVICVETIQTQDGVFYHIMFDVAFDAVRGKKIRVWLQANITPLSPSNFQEFENLAPKIQAKFNPADDMPVETFRAMFLCFEVSFSSILLHMFPLVQEMCRRAMQPLLLPGETGVTLESPDKTYTGFSYFDEHQQQLMLQRLRKLAAD